jgi:hypothetical protein
MNFLQDSENESIDNGDTTKDSSIEEDSDPDLESDLVSMSMVAETDHEKHSGSKHLFVFKKKILPTHCYLSH